MFGLVASDPTVSRTIDRLAGNAIAVLAAIGDARAAARARAYKPAGDHAPDRKIDEARPLVIDVDDSYSITGTSVVLAMPENGLPIDILPIGIAVP